MTAKEFEQVERLVNCDHCSGQRVIRKWVDQDPCGKSIYDTQECTACKRTNDQLWTIIGQMAWEIREHQSLKFSMEELNLDEN